MAQIPKVVILCSKEPWYSNKPNEPIVIDPLTKQDLINIGKRYSLVQVYFEDPMKNVITQDAKITLAGMISNIGGTLGIFLGLSMVTLFDALYQIFIFIKNLMPKIKSIFKCCK